LKLLKEVKDLNPEILFASNTSSLPIHKISEFSNDPSSVIGMHFFSPVPKMPLVEIIKTPETSDLTASATFDLASKMGKNIIVVNDGPGFYTTRILAFQIAEALLMLDEGVKIEELDEAMEHFGMPVGPITLLDEVGIDVGEHIMHVLKDAFKERIKMPKAIENITKENRKGRKNGKGFYLYVDGKKEGPDESIYKNFSSSQSSLSKEDMVDRCLYIFLNEAAHCLDENIIPHEDAGDLGAIFGLGFPPFLGGPFYYAHTIGKDQIAKKLKSLAEKFGPRFKPAKYWEN
jgi:3-hydroxyacyl-CoA dehydrogenase/enoyl-CoA hydratase/3-hydroxybutyryl-CoA epimerase